MKSHERITLAMNHTQPDRLPIGSFGHRSAGISAMAYARLRDFLKLPQKPIRVYDIIQQLAIVDEDVLSFFQVDAVELSTAFASENGIWHEWVLPDGRKCLIPIWIRPESQEKDWLLRSKSGQIIARMPDGSPYFDQIYFPLEDGHLPGSDLPEIMEECMWSAFKIPGPVTSKLPAEADKVRLVKEFRDNSDRAIIGMFGSSLLERGQQLFRHDKFYYMLASDPNKVHRILGMLTEYYLAELEHYLKVYGPYLDIIQFGDDLGMQTGPQISPQMYRELFKPYHQKMWRRAKELADIKVMLHSCGSIRAFLPDLIEAGIDAINPVQISARHMDAETLKHEFGERIVFWGGGCDTQQILPFGSKTEIQQHVKQQIDIFSAGGGYVFAQVHNIQSDVPPQNIVAMMQSVNEKQ